MIQLTNKDIDQYIYKTTGLIILDEDNEEVDPMEEEGFLSFEGLLALLLIAGTVRSRTESKQIINSLPNAINLHQLPQVNGAITRISTILASSALSTVDDNVPGSMADIVNRTTKSLNTVSIPEKDVLWLARNRALWASQYFTEDFTNNLRAMLLREASTFGANPELLSTVLKDKLLNAIDASENHYQIIAGNALNFARSYSIVRSGHELGKTTYQIIAVIDEVTTNICRALDQQVFQIPEAMAKFEEIASAESVKDLENISPMLNHDRSTGAIYYKVGGQRNEVDLKNPKALAKIGSMFPPFHFNCRSTIKWLQ